MRKREDINHLILTKGDLETNLLSLFPNLTSLHISVPLENDILSFHSSLQSLTINSAHSSDFFEPLLCCPSLTSLSISSNLTTSLRSFPPNLISFSILLTDPFISSLPLIPSTVTKLEGISLLDNMTLPPKLITLKALVAVGDITKVTFPSSSLKVCSFWDATGVPLLEGLLSLTLKGNKKVNLSNLPKSLIELRVMQPIEAFNNDILPPSLIHLSLLSSFIDPLPHLPSTLCTLILGNNFNQSLDNLPSSLTTLKLGNKFNHPLLSLPKSLTRLKLGDSFSYSLDYLPSSLLSLSLCNPKFNTFNALPHSLKRLTVWAKKESDYSYLSFLSQLKFYGKVSLNELHGIPRGVPLKCNDFDFEAVDFNVVVSIPLLTIGTTTYRPIPVISLIFIIQKR